MDELAAVDTYLGTVLRDYAGLRALIMPAGETRPRLFVQTAPPDQPFPYVTFSRNSGTPTPVIGGGLKRAAMQLDVTILSITDGPDLTLASSILNQIEAAINNTPSRSDIVINSTTYYVSIEYLVNPVSYIENDAGKQVNYYGGVYRFWINAL